MVKVCNLTPKRGINLFNNLKAKFGYDIAWRITSLTTLPDFINGRSFRRDSEGFPLMEDLLKDEVVRGIIGEQGIMKGLEKNFQETDNTRENYNYLLSQAYNFNSDLKNKKYIATVVPDGNKLKVEISFRTLENEKIANEQFATSVLNSKLANILSPIGIDISDLEDEEKRAGRIGVTDFTKINNIANSCINVIRVANNDEGSRAISEEFSHLIIGAYREEPLIQRALNALAKEDVLRAVLGAEFESVYDFEGGNLNLVAEEALGKLMQENLLAEVNNNPVNISTLLDRLYSNIKNKFKNVDAEAIQESIIEANSIIGQLAKDIISGNMKIEREKILKAQRDVQFNSLSERVDTNIEILKKLRDIEVKRFKISPKASAEEIIEQKKKINTLTLMSTGEKDTRIGILNYANQAIKDLQNTMDSLERKTLLGHPSFAAIRRARSYVQSYAGFIEDMRNAIFDAKDDSEVPDFLSNIVLEDGTIIDMADIINELAGLSDNVTALYNRYAKNMITEFFRPFFGNELIITAGEHKGEVIDIESVIKGTSSDISITDAILDSMADSSDTYLQLFDRVVKNSNDNIRLTTIDDSREVQRLMKFAEENGITDFEWMFEKDSNGRKSGNYISRINYAKFQEAKEAIQNELNEKYGEKAKGENAKKKIAEYSKWLSENTDPEDHSIPKDIEKYQNKDFMKLSGARLQFYKEFMNLKLLADSKYPDSRVQANKAIQMRKSAGNRIIESISNPSTMIENIKENMKQTFMDSADDDSLYGNSKTGLTNFDGTEYMTLPVLYTTRLHDPNELTTDVFASLISYQFAANTYAEMDKIVDPLEVARYWVSDKKRKINKTRGGKPIQEKISAAGQKIVNPIFEGNSNIERKINSYMESNVYQRYIKDEGTFKGISISKTGNWILHAASFAQLGFNFLANTANMATGLAMTNIEAAAGEYFNARELLSADKAYFGMMGAFMAELGSRVKTNKLSLFDELFNIKIDYNQQVKGNMKKGIMQKLFGENIAYLGQEGGDHWLYNRIAIAKCKAIKVLVPKQIKHIKKVRGLENAEKTVEEILLNSEHEHLTSDDKFYENDQSGIKSARVTSVIQEDNNENSFKETHEDGSPNNWITPSTNIGTGIDIMVRDFFDGLLYKDSSGKWHHDNLGDEMEKIYPNISETDMSAFLDQLKTLKQEFDNKGLKIVPKNIVARGVLTINDGGSLKDLNVAGTLDLLAYDKNGDFYIYDMKTHRGKITNQKRHKWSAQLSLYKRFLQEEYGINIKSLHIIPIKVSYPTPSGEVTGDREGITDYTVKDNSNQLYADGKEFKGASPKLESIINLNESTISVEYDSLGYNKKASKNHNIGEYDQMSLWDALQIVDIFEDRSDIKKMILPEGTIGFDGVPIDIKKISREIQDINIHLFGAYNQEDSNAANRVVLGRALQQYRKWIKPQFNKRFQAAQVNVLTGKTVEGYYRTFGNFYYHKFLGNFMNEALRGKVQMVEHWSDLSDDERANIKRAWTEIIQFLFVYLIAAYAPWPDDKNRPWALKYAEYMAKREAHELGMLTPSLSMLSETLKTVQSPMPVLSAVNDVLRLAKSSVHPEDWVDEKQSGPYKGLSTWEANFLKAPLPVISQWRQIEKFGNQLDNSILFYARPN